MDLILSNPSLMFITFVMIIQLMYLIHLWMSSKEQEVEEKPQENVHTASDEIKKEPPKTVKIVHFSSQIGLYKDKPIFSVVASEDRDMFVFESIAVKSPKTNNYLYDKPDNIYIVLNECLYREINDNEIPQVLASLNK